MGILTKPYELIFCKSIAWILKGKRIPKFMMDSVMGKNNNSIVEMLYLGITSKTIKNACKFVYKYDVPESIEKYSGDTLFWYGENETYPKKSAVLLKSFLPNMKIESYKDMGHGQYLHEHSEEYAMKLIAYLEK